MSDLSRMLDDLYTMPETGDEAADDTPTRAPSWSSVEALDEAFASWVPGPADGSTAMERSMVAEAFETSSVDHNRTVDQWLAETEPEPEPVALPRWSPSDDDIVPSRRRPVGRRRGR